MPLLYYLALVCITFYPFSDERRPNRPSFDATLKSTFTKEAKSVYLYLPHAVKNVILLHKVIARFMFLYNRFPCSDMFFSKNGACQNHINNFRCSCSQVCTKTKTTLVTLTGR